ncbi:MAG: 16S rRNA (cytosine(1402)-N(4))-methyltransferase RsmH [Fuerstiella sp.]
MESQSVHVSVMPREVLHYMQLVDGLTVMDGTVGAAGHGQQILARIGSTGRLLGFDRDPMMLGFAKDKLPESNVQLFHSSYLHASEILAEAGIDGVDRVFLDLGLSSDQLADRERGFGFDAGGPLDMRFDASKGESAAEFLAISSAEALATVFREFADEPFADRIAEQIVSQRRTAPIKTTSDLEESVRRAIPRGATKSGKNPATRVFQALRIAVNKELEHVQNMMTDVLPKLLKPGGIAVILTFHSLEDRIVKSGFKGKQEWQLLTKTPIESTPAEIRINPRSRSAKLRAAQRKSL